MISKKYKFGFVHIPRTGGTSITDFLFDKDSNSLFMNKKRKKPVWQNPQTKKEVASSVRHNKLSEIESYLGNEFNSYYMFTVVRNPWDRLASLFYFRKNGSIPTSVNSIWAMDKVRDIVRKWTFDTFIKRVCLSNHNNIKDSGIIPQILYVIQPSKFNKIIRYEKLEDDFKEVCGDLNIEFDKLPVIHKTSRMAYVQLYNDELRELVYEKYKSDIETFGFKFGE